METKKRRHRGLASASAHSHWTRGLALGTPLLALGLGVASPVRAASTVIDTAISGPITVNAGDEVDLVTGGSVAVGDNATAVVVNAGGTLKISGGSVSAGTNSFGVEVDGGTVSIYGGSVSGGPFGTGLRVFSGRLDMSGGSVSWHPGAGVIVYQDGTASISGGSISGDSAGVRVFGGTLNISGGSVAAGSLPPGAPPGAATKGVDVEGGAAAITGGSVTAGTGGLGVYDDAGTVTVSGGSISANLRVTGFTGGTVTLSGCGLLLSNSQPLAGGGTQYTLTGTLLSGTAINTGAEVFPPGQFVLDNLCSGGGLGSLASSTLKLVIQPAPGLPWTDQATLHVGQCATLRLFARTATGVTELTHDPNATYFTDPPRDGFTAGNQTNQFCPSAGDANQAFPIYGRYVDPKTGITTTNQVHVVVRP